MKAWHQPELWEKCYLSPQGRIYLHAGKIIGYAGVNAMAFYDEAKKLPFYNKLAFENAVRDMTVYAKREQGSYELTATARKVLRVILGPAPDDPTYEEWWRLRMISVEQMRRDGVPVEWAAEPPVPLKKEEPKPQKRPPKKEPKKPTRKKKAG